MCPFIRGTELVLWVSLSESDQTANLAVTHTLLDVALLIHQSNTYYVEALAT